MKRSLSEFFPRAIILWNSLPKNLHDAKTADFQTPTSRPFEALALFFLNPFYSLPLSYIFFLLSSPYSDLPPPTVHVHVHIFIYIHIHIHIHIHMFRQDCEKVLTTLIKSRSCRRGKKQFVIKGSSIEQSAKRTVDGCKSE